MATNHKDGPQLCEHKIENRNKETYRERDKEHSNIFSVFS